METHTLEGWLTRLGASGDQLTLEQVQALATMIAGARLETIQGLVEGMEIRLTRLETFISATIPNYDATVTAIIRHMADDEEAKEQVDTRELVRRR